MTSGPPPFPALYGRAATVTAEAPGRVNLIGDHTDYNGGYVLPAILPQDTRVELALRPDRRMVAWSTEEPEAPPRGFELGDPAPPGGWLDYVHGVTRLLEAEGITLGGADLRLSTEVPPGAGLASSAALEVALLRAFRTAFALAFDDLALALLAHRAEVEFVGIPVGVMDQMAASLGRAGSALFLDTRTLAFEWLPLPADLALVVIHSGVRHRNTSGGYRVRREECREACHLLGVNALRDLEGATDLPARLRTLPAPLDRRVRHVLNENQRVLAAASALRRGDLLTLGELFHASHESLRREFEVSIPETDLLVDLARQECTIFGARLTGGGFGGSVVMAATGDTAPVALRLAREYHRQAGRTPTILLPPLPAQDLGARLHAEEAYRR